MVVVVAEPKPYARAQWTAEQLERARELAFDVGLECPSIAKLLAYEYGTSFTRSAVRYVLVTHYNWRGTPRGRNCQ